MNATADRISTREARDRLKAGARLVCAYDSDEKFRQNRLEGGIPLSELRSREGDLPKETELIFYCA
jgi:hypothetical protein